MRKIFKITVSVVEFKCSTSLKRQRVHLVTVLVRYYILIEGISTSSWYVYRFYVNCQGLSFFILLMKEDETEVIRVELGKEKYATIVRIL